MQWQGKTHEGRRCVRGKGCEEDVVTATEEEQN